MTERQGSNPAPQSRALAELPLEGALARREQIAGRWVVALVGSRPLEDLPALPLPMLASRAPELCGLLIEAVGSDAALERLRGAGREIPAGEFPAGEFPAGAAGAGDVDGGQRALGELTGARTAAELVDAVELLRGVVAGALLDAASGLSPRQTADLCERVAHVCAVALAGALPGSAAGLSRGHAGGALGGDTPAGTQPTALSGAPPLIVDELRDGPPTGPAADVPRRDREDAAAIAIRDQRGEHAPAEWLEAIARELERHEPEELPFAVLLVELRDLERMRLQSTPARLAADLASLERVLSENGSVVRERPGRYWVLAPGADRHGARALAERLQAAVSSAAGGESLRALVGLAVYPADGRHAAALAAHADVDLIAARTARR